MADDVQLNTAVLDKLIRALKQDMPKARVGILGSKDARSGSNDSNATVGAIHEFGSSTHAKRSFLREPLNDNLNDYLEKSGAFDEDTLKEVISSGSALSWMKKIALVAEQVIGDAFKTSGFGKWAAWKTEGYSSNTGQILVDTNQLRDSITSEVK